MVTHVANGPLPAAEVVFPRYFAKYNQVLIPVSKVAHVLRSRHDVIACAQVSNGHDWISTLGCVVGETLALLEDRRSRSGDRFRRIRNINISLARNEFCSKNSYNIPCRGFPTVDYVDRQFKRVSQAYAEFLDLNVHIGTSRIDRGDALKGSGICSDVGILLLLLNHPQRAARYLRAKTRGIGGLLGRGGLRSYLAISSLHNARLPSGDSGVTGSDSRSQQCRPKESLLEAIFLISLGFFVTWYVFVGSLDGRCDDAGYFLVLPLGGFLSMAGSFAVLINQLLSRARFCAYSLYDVLDPPWNPRIGNQLFRGIIEADETRIPRRNESRGEFRESGTGRLADY